MKRNYQTPDIRIQSVDVEDFLDESLPVFETTSDKEDDIITKSEEVLGNRSVWDDSED